MKQFLALALSCLLVVSGCGDSTQPSSPVDSLPRFAWDPVEDNEALATCLIAKVGVNHLANERLYRTPAAECFALINPSALLHRDIDVWASCISAGWSWIYEMPSDLVVSWLASAIEETCFTFARG